MHLLIPSLPRGWNRRTKAALLQILALSHYTQCCQAAVGPPLLPAAERQNPSD